MPCCRCNSLQGANDGDKKLSLWMQPSALLESAKGGCPFCCLLRDSITTHILEEVLTTQIRVVYVSTRRYENGNRTKGELFWEDGSYETKFELYISKGAASGLVLLQENF